MATLPDTGDVGVGAFSVTKSDSTTFSRMPRALYVGGEGDVAVRTAEGTNVTFASVPAGTILPIRCDRVLSTGTTATNIVALY